MKAPKISVVMPVYNSAKYLQETVDSILNQTYSDFELIILNDKSTDNSKEIIERYLKKDNRIVFIDKEINVGPANLRNEGFERAKGEYIALMDSDDIASPTRFEKQVAILDAQPEIGVCGTWFTFFGGKKDKTVTQPEHQDEIKVSFLSSCSIGNPTVMLRKTALKNFRFQNEFVPVEDYDLWSRMITETNFYIVQESLLQYRQHEQNISKTKIDNVNRSVKKVKTNWLLQFGIFPSDPNTDVYLNALTLKRGLHPEEIKKVIQAARYLNEQNQKLRNFSQKLLEKQTRSIVLRSIRNASEYNLAFFNFLRKEETTIYNQIRLLDKIILFFKSVLNWKQK